MGALQRGAIVLVRFPFSDLSQTKLRPAVVLAGAGRGDWILCQVTSKPYGDARIIQLENRSVSPRARCASQATHAPPGSSPPVRAWWLHVLAN